ncbi:hypothetical protein ABIB06_002511 [Bradyrhizobium sp. LB8.2]|uniref:lipocalin-like domain-containing protein n=1 Tax=unclassified Bradyrhizobium TaxID=2631580 RepID=UPI003392BB96
MAQSIKATAVGSWTLVSYVSTAGDGTKRENLGPNPIGAASFDAKGNFMISIIRSDLPKIASGNREQGTPAENGAIVRGLIAYFGNYTVAETGDELIVKIEGATLPNWIGSTQKRGAVMPSADELYLVNSIASGGGVAEIRRNRNK